MVSLSLLLLFLQDAKPSAVPRICVETMKGEVKLGEVAADAISAALLSSRRVRIVEDCEKADFALKGSIVERADIKSRSESEDTGVASIAISADRYSAAGAGMGAHGSETISSTETKRSVTLTARVVSKDGEVVYATTQDSAPSRNKSAINEAADKLSRDLLKAFFPDSPASKQSSGYKKIQ